MSNRAYIKKIRVGEGNGDIFSSFSGFVLYTVSIASSSITCVK